MVAAAGGAVWSNFTKGFVGCLDYIMYSKQSMLRRKVLRMPSARVLASSTALPSAQVRNDLVSLTPDGISVKSAATVMDFQRRMIVFRTTNEFAQRSSDHLCLMACVVRQRS